MVEAVRTRGLTKRFGDSLALDRLDLTVPTGEVFGFVGPNGAGKTTTIRTLLDLVRPTSGEVEVLGLSPRNDGVALRRRLGYLPGDLSLPARITGRAFLTDQAAIRRSDASSIDTFAERLDADLDRPMGELSLGNRRKIGVIAAFFHEPELVVLDEPTSGLDPLVQQEFRVIVREVVADGRTVFLSSHVLDEVQHLADRVAVLRAGTLVAEDRVDVLLASLVRHVRVLFDGPVPDASSLSLVPGVSAVDRVGDHELRVVLAGPAGALLAALAPLGPSDLHTSEPDLEQAFLGLYSGGAA